MVWPTLGSRTAEEQEEQMESIYTTHLPNAVTLGEAYDRLVNHL